jgi:hypothetical protein
MLKVYLVFVNKLRRNQTAMVTRLFNKHMQYRLGTSARTVSVEEPVPERTLLPFVC